MSRLRGATGEDQRLGIRELVPVAGDNRGVGGGELLGAGASLSEGRAGGAEGGNDLVGVGHGEQVVVCVVPGGVEASRYVVASPSNTTNQGRMAVSL